MKRTAKRVYKPISREKQAELNRVRQQILRDEKAEISARARAIFADVDAARTELARTAELLRAERQGQNLSLADMQDRTGISRSALCRLENLTESNPTVRTLEKVARALGKRLIVGLQD